VARRIVYPKSLVRSTRAGKRKPGRVVDESQQDVDGYRDKLVKYVPVEATAFFTLAYGALHEALDVKNPSDRLWWILLLLLGGVIAVLFAGGAGRVRTPKPWYFYLLTSISFVAWAVGTTGVAQEIWTGWLSQANDVVLAAAAFLIPGLDQWLTTSRTTLS
jgi:hypothetical protein